MPITARTHAVDYLRFRMNWWSLFLHRCSRCCSNTRTRRGRRRCRPTSSTIHCQWHRGLYGSTSCWISHGPCQWERAIFDPNSSDTPRLILMKLEIYNYFPYTIQHVKFQGATSTWVVWANSQFDAWKFLYFLFTSSPGPQVMTHPRAQDVIIRHSGQGGAFGRGGG